MIRKTLSNTIKFILLTIVILYGITEINDNYRGPDIVGEGKMINVENIPETRKEILTESKKHIGTPYSFGSKDPTSGFDNSGYVSYVYEKSLNFKLPLGSRNMYSDKSGKTLTLSELNLGDLMFFSHNGSKIQHVGIYIDENHFIHSPRTGRVVSIDEIDRYWKQKFVIGKTYLK